MSREIFSTSSCSNHWLFATLNQRAVAGRKRDLATSGVGRAGHVTAYPKVGVGYQRRLRTEQPARSRRTGESMP